MSVEKGPPAKCRTLKKETPLIRATGPILGVAEVLQRPVANERPLEARGYSRVKQIGKGAFGRAILVRNVTGESYVAKEINLMAIAPHEKDMARTEIKVLRTLDHPNVIRYVDHFEESGLLYILMEYADAGDLGRLLRGLQQPLPESEILGIFAQVCLALAHVHERHILHRDIKPANIFLAKGRKVSKLGDFGISTVLRGAHASAKAQCGTPYYFSPEVCQQQPYNTKSDVWSLGCLLYEMLTLKRPFNAPNLRTLMTAICKGVYPTVGDQYSKEMHQLVSQMLTRDPEHRPAIAQILSLPFVRVHVKPAVPTMPKSLDTQADKQRLMSKLMDALGKSSEAADCAAAPRERQEVRSAIAQKRPHSSGPVLRHPRETPEEPGKEKEVTAPAGKHIREQVQEMLRHQGALSRPACKTPSKQANDDGQQYVTLGDLPERDAGPDVLLRNGININFNINVSNNNFTTTHHNAALTPGHASQRPADPAGPRHASIAAPMEAPLADSEVYRNLMVDIQRHLPVECCRGPLDQLWRVQAQFISQQLAARFQKSVGNDSGPPSSIPKAELEEESGSDKPPSGVLACRMPTRKRRPLQPAQATLGARDVSPHGKTSQPGTPSTAPKAAERATSQASTPEVSRAKSKYLQAIQNALGYATEGLAEHDRLVVPSLTAPEQVPSSQGNSSASAASGALGFACACEGREASPQPDTAVDGEGASSHPLHAMVDLLLGEGEVNDTAHTGSQPAARPPAAAEQLRRLQERLRSRQHSTKAPALQQHPMAAAGAEGEHQEHLLDDLLAVPTSTGKSTVVVQHPRVQLLVDPPQALQVQPRLRHLQAPSPMEGQRERYHRCQRSSTPTPEAAAHSACGDTVHAREARTAEQQQLLRHLRLQQEQQVRRLQHQQQQWRQSQKAAGMEALTTMEDGS